MKSIAIGLRSRPAGDRRERDRPERDRPERDRPERDRPERDRPERDGFCDDTRADGWLIPGGDPASWLDEIAGWGVPMRGLRLLVLPRSIRDRTARGVLVVVPDGPTPRVSSRPRPYVRFGGCLYHPRDARIDPAIDEDELARMAAGRTLVLVPPGEVVGFAPEDALSVADLLESPPIDDEQWDAACAGVTMSETLGAVHRTVVDDDAPEIGDAGDIGSEAETGAPPAPGEGAIRHVGYHIARGLARAVHATSSRLRGKDRPSDESTEGPGDDREEKGGGSGEGRGRESWLGRLAKWSGDVAASIDEKLRRARHRELLRLSHLLDQDPDRGLRFAIPITGGGHRGLVQPGASLPERRIDFDVTRLGGGRPADPWEIPGSIYSRLIEQYVAAASRALSEKRFRRAAYILAELLGDHEAAANALRQGGHYREAAVLFRDHVDRPLEAARCLEEGGLLQDAIELYESIGEFERAGDLHARVDNTEAAERCYHGAVASLTASGDFVGAAGILERKLALPRDAYALLRSAWPDGRGADRCIGEALDLLGRQGWHDEAMRLVGELCRAPVASPDWSWRRHGRLGAAMNLAKQARRYPDDAVRARSADSARVLIGRMLDDHVSDETETLTRMLAGLDPDDRVLARDASHFASRRRGTTRKARRRSGSAHELVFRRALELPPGYRWTTFAGVGEILYAAGESVLRGNRSIAACRLTWRGHYRDITTKTGVGSGELILAVDPRERNQTMFGVPGGAREMQPASRKWPEVIFPAGPPAVGMPRWMPDDVRGVAYDPAGDLHVVTARPEALVISRFTTEGHLRDRRVVPGFTRVRPTAIFPPTRLVATARATWLIAGERVIGVDRGGEPCPATFATARSIQAAPGFDLLVACDAGAAVIGPTLVSVFGADVERPHVVATRERRIVLIGEGEGRVYAANGNRLVCRLTFTPPDIRIAGLLLTDSADEIAIAGESGVVHVFRLPARAMT